MHFSENIFYEMPVVGILRNISCIDILNILPIYAEAGFNTVEITMNSPDAETSIRKAINEFGHILNIGAGTVTNIVTLESALRAGAQFIVSPHVNKEIIFSCKEQGVPIYAGAFTPTEILTAWELGAFMVKIFPAGEEGVSYIKLLRASLNQVPLLPTGGITLANAGSYLKAGAVGIGIGSSLFTPMFIAEKNWLALKNNFSRFASIVRMSRNSTKSNHAHE